MNGEGYNTIVRKELEMKKSSFLTFYIGQEKYALDILCVQEIQRYHNIVPIQNAPDYIKGVMRLRDTTVIIIDFRIYFHFEKVEYTEYTIVIIIHINQRILGLVIDSTPDIITVNSSQVTINSEILYKIPNTYIKGIVLLNDQTLILLDPEKFITHETFMSEDLQINSALKDPY